MKELLRTVAMESHDPDTQTAAVALTEDGQTALYAANTLPEGVEALPHRVSRPGKYDYINHAERRLVALAARFGIKLYGLTLALNWFPCAGCAQVIIDAGFSVVWVDRKAYAARKDDPQYKFARAMELLVSAGVEIRWH